jgi:hypothetical protein
MQVGQRYRCQNPDCRCEVEVVKASMETTTNPRCCCGVEMKRPYEKPGIKKRESQPAGGEHQ